MDTKKIRIGLFGISSITINLSITGGSDIDLAKNVNITLISSTISKNILYKMFLFPKINVTTTKNTFNQSKERFLFYALSQQQY